MSINLNSFLKSALILVAGTALAQIVKVAVTPLLTRLYSPSDFGILNLIISIVAILTSISSLKYNQAIVIAENDRESLDLTKLTIIINGLFSVFLFVLILIFSYQFSLLLGNESVRFYLFLIPVIIFFESFFVSSKSFAIKTKKFKIISSSGVFKAIISSVLQIVMGILNVGTFGLISGPLSSAIFVNKYIFNKVTKDFKVGTFRFWHQEEKNKYLFLLKKYINFPKFTVASSLASTLTLTGINIFVFTFYSAEELGYLALAQLVLSLPLNLISGAIGDVFFQRIAATKNDKVNSSKIFIKTFRVLLLMSLSGILIGYFTLEQIFPIFFGEEWQLAGYYSTILVFLYGIRFINSPLSVTFIVFDKQKELLKLTSFQLLILAILMLFSIVYKIDFMNFISYYVISQSIFYFLYLYRSWRIAQKN